MRAVGLVVSMKHKDFIAGYEQALADMKNLLDNALANGSILHYYHELVDQINILKEEIDD